MKPLELWTRRDPLSYSFALEVDMPRLVLLVVLSLTIIADPAEALVMCAPKRPTGVVREGAPIKLRTSCKANEIELDPAGLGLQGPAGPQGDPGAPGATGPVGETGPAGAPPEKVRVHLTAPVNVNSGPNVCSYEEIVVQFASAAEDTHEMHDPTGDPTKVVIAEPGTYLITVQFRVYSQPEAGDSIAIRRNGTTNVGLTTFTRSSSNTQLTLSTTAVLDQGDFLQLIYEKPQICGGLVVLQDFSGTEVTVTRIAAE